MPGPTLQIGTLLQCAWCVCVCVETHSINKNDIRDRESRGYLCRYVCLRALYIGLDFRTHICAIVNYDRIYFATLTTHQAIVVYATQTPTTTTTTTTLSTSRIANAIKILLLLLLLGGGWRSGPGPNDGRAVCGGAPRMKSFHSVWFVRARSSCGGGTLVLLGGAVGE